MPEKFVYGADFTDERGCPVKPGMTAGGVVDKKSPFGERAGWISAVRRLQFSQIPEHLFVLLGEFFCLVSTDLF